MEYTKLCILENMKNIIAFVKYDNGVSEEPSMPSEYRQLVARFSLVLRLRSARRSPLSQLLLKHL
jgi:hypothetical protein